MMPRSIAKVNAKSIDGYFGVGTPCFFIRGTILADTPINGEYPSLSFTRTGNVIEVESFDRIWAVVTIRTRAGNRPGDNVMAQLYLRDDDLKAHGVDCERIENLNGLPFSFDVASLAAEGLFDHRDLEPYIPVEDDPDPPPIEPPPVARTEAPRPQPLAPQPQPQASPPPPVPVPPPAAPAPPPNAAEPAAEKPAASRPAEGFDFGHVVELLRAPFGESPIVQIGASVAAVAVPVLVYVALSYLKNQAPEDEEP